jgi:hypothetical protein
VKTHDCKPRLKPDNANQRSLIVYEVNTWVWLQSLRVKYGRWIDLGSVPAKEWDALADMHCNAIWLMGVWQRSQEGRRIALEQRGLIAECRRILPDFTEDDVPGSAFSIKSYTVDSRLGSLGAARAELAQRGLRLILDFIPNHVGHDHDWVFRHPEFFIRGDIAKLNESPDGYFEADGSIIACGRDPFFPAWTDTAQLNAFSPQLREAALETLQHIAAQCDGVRCDMAMLLLNDVFSKTWGDLAGPPPQCEFWTEMIGGVRQVNRDFVFIAEAYWDRESDLQQLGFDYCYDKRLYDRLVHDDAQSVRDHLAADISYQERLIRFLENHDEARAAQALPRNRMQAAAVVVATTPGATLYHQGQFCGAHIHVPVQLGRRPVEPCDENLANFYSRLRSCAEMMKAPGAIWRTCEALGWADNRSAGQLLAWTWQTGDQRFLIVINYGDGPAQARLRLPWSEQTSGAWLLRDLMSGERFERDALEMQRDGLYVARDAWEYHVLAFESRKN